MKRHRIARLTCALVFVLCLPAGSGTLFAGDSAPRKLADSSGKCMETLLRMRIIQTVVEAWAIDFETYPAAASMDDLRAKVEPRYVASLPLGDAWGTPFLYRRSADGKSYRLISAGSDRSFDEPSWSSPGRLESSREDAVLSSAGAGSDREWTVQQ
jgi:hypothetical protein